MKLGLLFLGLLSVAGAANAVTLAQWTFESLPSAYTGSTGSTGQTVGPFVAEAGLNAATAFATGYHASSSQWTGPVGNGSAKALSSNNWAVGDYYQFQVSTVGYKDLALSFDQAGSSTGPKEFKVQVSVDGTNFSDVVSYNVLQNTTPISWSSTYHIEYNNVVNLSSWLSLNNQSALYVRLTGLSTTAISGATVSSSGTSRVDNVVISGTAQPVPEPFTMGLGLAAAGVFVRRRTARKSA